MPVIDLNSGKITQDAPDIAGSIQTEKVKPLGGIIDLDTGLFVSGTPSVEPGQSEPIQEAPAQSISELIPQAATAVGEAVETIQAPETGIGDFFTGSERIKATPELGELPEFGGTPESGRAFGILTTLDPKAQVQILKDSIPGATTETTPDGSIIIEVPIEGGGTRRSVLNRPGFSGQDIVDAVTQIIQFLPAAKLATLGKTLLKKFGFGAVGAAATEQALQETGIEFLGREQRDPAATAIAGVAGGAGELIVPAVQAIRQGRQAAKIGAERATVAEAQQAIKPAQEAVAGLKEATGTEVGLFQAQQTQLPSDILKQRILPQLDAGSRKAASSLEAQNKEVFEATSELINTIAGPEVTVSGAKQFRAASEKAIKAANEERRSAVKPLYDAAFEEARKQSKQVDLEPVTDFIELQLKDLVSDDPASIALNSFLKRLQGEKLPDKPSSLIVGEGGEPVIAATKGGNKPLTLEQLQSAKFTTDAQIDKSGGLILNSAQKNAKRLLSQAEKLYVDQLGELSPAFKSANEEFARLSPAVKEVEDSLLGVAAKVKDVDLQNISRRIFAPNSNPTVVKNAKALIDKVDPDAWNNMLRSEIQRRFGGIKTLSDDLPGELVGNVPGQLRRAIFGNPEQRRTLLAAMNPDQRKNFVYLDEVLRRASSGRQAGSPTASFGAALDRLRGVGGVLRDVIFRPLETLQKTGESGLFDRNVAALTEVLFDPKFKPQLSKLRKLNPNSPASARAMTQLLNDTQSSGAENE